MKKWIPIGFIVLIIALSVFFLLFIDGFIKRQIVENGTQSVGAKVELDNADLSLFPLGLTLTGLQVTDREKPMTNAVEIAKIACLIEGRNLLGGKVIIEEMTLDGLRLGTPRKTSGAITEGVSTSSEVSSKKEGEEFQLPSIGELPSVEEILEKEQLESMELIESIKGDFKTKKKNWKKRLEELPNEKKVEEYKRKLEKFKKFKKGNLLSILGGIRDGADILKEVRHDLELIKAAGNDLKMDMALLRKRQDEAKKALQNDIRHLKEKYSLSSNSITNVSGLLFGEKIGEYTKNALYWYEKIKPFLERDAEQKEEVKTEAGEKGVDVRFKESGSLPDFLIRLTEVTNMETQIGTLNGRIENITPDQEVLGVPLTFLFSGDKIKSIESIKIDGVFDHIAPSNSKDTVNFQVKKYKVRDVPLSDNEKLPATLEEGSVDFDVKTTLSGEALTASLMADFSSTKLSLGGKGEVNSLINSALSDVTKFNLGADITGTLTKQDIKLKSSLDDIIKDIGGKLVKDQAAKFEKELHFAINQKVSGELNKLKKDIGGLKALDGDLAGRTRLLRGLL